MLGYSKIVIKSEPEFNGCILKEPSFSQQIYREYEILQGVVELTNGLGTMFIKCIADPGFQLNRTTLLPLTR